MISYASICEIEGDIVSCEVEQLSFRESRVDDFDKECVMMDVPRSMFEESCPGVSEGDVVFVKHKDGVLIRVFRLALKEKQRRTEYLASLM